MNSSAEQVQAETENLLWLFIELHCSQHYKRIESGAAKVLK